MSIPIKDLVFEKYDVIETNQANLPAKVLCRITYPICNIGKLNANNRMYGRDVWDKVLQSEGLQEKLEKRCLYGHAEHPKESQSRLEKTSHVVNRMWIDENDNKVKQEIDVLDTPYGRIVDTLVQAGCGVGVSTRADGELEEATDEKGEKYLNVLSEPYNYITTDFTADPSTIDPYPEDVQMRMVDCISKDQNEIDDGFAIAVLEGLQVSQAKDLCESIKQVNKDVATSEQVTLQIDESTANDSSKSLVKKIFDFIDKDWKEKREKEIIELIKEYRERFVLVSKDKVVDYLRRLWHTNEKISAPFVSDEFKQTYQSLLEVDDEEDEDLIPSSDEEDLTLPDEIEVENNGEDDMEQDDTVLADTDMPPFSAASPVGGEDVEITTPALELPPTGALNNIPEIGFTLPEPIVEPSKVSLDNLSDRLGFLEFMTDSGNNTSNPYLTRLSKERMELLDDLSGRYNRAMSESKDKEVKTQIDEKEVDETEDVKALYKKTEFSPPEGKGVHTKKFHEVATSIMKSLKEDPDVKDKSADAIKTSAYKMAMSQLGKDKAVKKGHRSESIKECYWEMVDYLSGKPIKPELIMKKDEEKKPKGVMSEADIIAGRLEETKKKSASSIYDTTVDWMIKEALTRVEKDKAVELIEQLEESLQVNESSRKVETKILFGKLKEELDILQNKYGAVKNQLKETFDKLKIAVGKLDAIQAEADKQDKKFKELEDEFAKKEAEHETELQARESNFTKEKKQILTKYIESKFAGVKSLPKRTQALLEECSTIEQLDEAIINVRQDLSEDALHSTLNEGTVDEINVLAPTTDPKMAEITNTIKKVFEGMH